MSKYVRRARDQLQTVRADVVKKQIQSVRGELKHGSRSKPLTTSSASLKFSDIDCEDTSSFKQSPSQESPVQQNKSYLFDDDDVVEVSTNGHSTSHTDEQDSTNSSVVTTSQNSANSQKMTLFDDPDTLFGDDLEEDFFSETRSKNPSKKQDIFDDLFAISDDSPSVGTNGSYSKEEVGKTMCNDVEEPQPSKIDEASLLSFIDGDLLQHNPLPASESLPPPNNEETSAESIENDEMIVTDSSINDGVNNSPEGNEPTSAGEGQLEQGQLDQGALDQGALDQEMCGSNNHVQSHSSQQQCQDAAAGDDEPTPLADKSLPETVSVEVEDTPLFVDDTYDYFSSEDMTTNSVAGSLVSPTSNANPISTHSEASDGIQSHGTATVSTHSEATISTRSHACTANTLPNEGPIEHQTVMDDASNGRHCSSTGNSSLVSSYNGGSSSLSVSGGEMSPSSLSSSPTAYGSSFPQQVKRNQSGKRAPIVPPRPQVLRSSSMISGSSTVSCDSGFDDTVSINSIPFDDHTYDTPVSSTHTHTPPVAMATSEKQVTGDSEEDYTLIVHFFFTILLYLYYSFNPFVYLAGFVAGFLVFYLITGSAFVLYVQQSEREKVRRKGSYKGHKLVPLDELPLTINLDFESNRVLESNQFGLVHQYHPLSHHPSQVLPTKLTLHKDFILDIRYRKTIQNPQGGGHTHKTEVINLDLRSCSVLIVPEEVAQNRKRRWSKKFPISLSWPTKERVYLFTFTSKEKEEWFRRLRTASEGVTYDELCEDLKIYYGYMGKYMPSDTTTTSLTPPRPPPSYKHHHKLHMPHIHHKHREAGHKSSAKPLSSVSFSVASTLSEEDESEKVISITRQDKKASSNQNSLGAVESTHGNGNGGRGSQDSYTIKAMPKSLPLNLSMGWINAGLARIAWDVFHEEMWNRLVTSRIQRKLIRIKTPSFMEPLKVTEVHMGMDIPVINRPFKLPMLDHRGIWVYLDVSYRGTFTMTIETKLKLEGKRIGDILHFNVASSESSPSVSPTPPSSSGGAHRHRVRLKTQAEDEEISSGSDEEESSSLDQSLEAKMPQALEAEGIVLNPEEEETSSAQSSLHIQPSAHQGRKEKLLTNVVSRLQKIAAKSRIVAKAAEKMSSYPLVLTVEVNRLDGLLVVNMAPPPSDALWFGFAKNPNLELIARPKLGQRQVTLSYVTEWIEKKLCNLVEKKLVLPNMEDIVIPVLSSGLPEDKIKDF